MKISRGPFQLMHEMGTSKCVVLLDVYVDTLVTSCGNYELGLERVQELGDEDKENLYVYFDNHEGKYYLPPNYMDIKWEFSDDEAGWSEPEQPATPFIDYEQSIFKDKAGNSYRFVRCKVVDYGT